MVQLCKMLMCCGFLFFHFFKILVFWVVTGLKKQKIVQNDKKLRPSGSISEEPYIKQLPFIFVK